VVGLTRPVVSAFPQFPLSAIVSAFGGGREGFGGAGLAFPECGSSSYASTLTRFSIPCFYASTYPCYSTALSRFHASALPRPLHPRFHASVLPRMRTFAIPRFCASASCFKGGINFRCFPERIPMTRTRAQQGDQPLLRARASSEPPAGPPGGTACGTSSPPPPSHKACFLVPRQWPWHCFPVTL
jgi:hypothetical protein